MNLNEMTELAIAAATAAGKLVLTKLSEQPTATAKDGKAYNVVTQADVDAEALIMSLIRDRCPDHAFLAEESGASPQQSDHLWIIDPLDGTNNYARGFPVFAISIALAQAGRLMLGVVYDPTRQELFVARRDQGATLNGNRIRVSSVGVITESMLATGFYYERGDMMRQTLRQMERFFDRHVVGIRRMGSAALDLCYVACGRFDGFWELKLSPWDYAAGCLIVTEAGGRVTDIAGGDFDLMMGNVLASNGGIHAAMTEVVQP